MQDSNNGYKMMHQNINVVLYLTALHNCHWQIDLVRYLIFFNCNGKPLFDSPNDVPGEALGIPKNKSMQ